MDYRTADPQLYGAPAQQPPPPHHHHHHQQQQILPQPYLSSYTCYPSPNPNPNPVPTHDNPAHFLATADTGILGPPGVNPYLPDPYAPHGGYEGHHVLGYGYSPAAAATSYYHGAPGGGDGQCEVHPLNYGAVRTNVGMHTTFEDLETKKRKLIEAGTAADLVRVCSVCNVVCNSDTVFAAHLAGEKHALKVLGRSSNGSIGVMRTVPTPVTRQKAINAKRKSSKKAPKVVQSVYCEVCKLECNSQDVLTIHKQGKKHKKNLQKLQESITAKPVNAPTAPTAKETSTVTDQGKAVGEKQKKTTPVTEDLETKKRKILDAGAAADAVRVCAVCNIVCNSQMVFESHMAGQKHAAMVKQQQEPAPIG